MSAGLSGNSLTPAIAEHERRTKLRTAFKHSRISASLLVLAGMILVASCAQSTKVVTRTETVYVSVPEALLHCQSRPEVPPDGATQGWWRVYTIRLHAWGDDCEDTLNRARDWVDKHSG